MVMEFSINWLASLTFVVDWLIKLAFIFYIPKKRKPSSAIAWLLLLFLIPGIGIILFLIIGSPKLSRKRRLEQAAVDRMIDDAHSSENTSVYKGLPKEKFQRIKSITELNKALGKLPLTQGNSVKILPEYNKAIDDIVTELNKAKQFIHMEYFIIALDETIKPIFDALELAVKRGVEVRVMFDGVGYRSYPRRKEMTKILTDIGVEWHIMLPFRLSLKEYNRFDLRNHRKILVIDDSIAYIGSQNLVDRTYHRKDDIYYDELVAKLSGPVVRQCNVIFAGDWFFETGEKLSRLTDAKSKDIPAKTGDVLAQIVPSGPGYETLNNAKLFATLIHKAEKRVFITNPYFVPEDAILDAITSASHRGVEVNILNSEAIDQWMVGHAQRSYYEELLNAGVNIYLYKKPILLHSKHITIDDDIAVIGSSNMDIRSFELDLECVVVVYDKSVVKDLQKVQKLNLKRTRKIKLSEWQKRDSWSKFKDSLARLTAAIQ